MSSFNKWLDPKQFTTPIRDGDSSMVPAKPKPDDGCACGVICGLDLYVSYVFQGMYVIFCENIERMCIFSDRIRIENV